MKFAKALMNAVRSMLLPLAGGLETLCLRKADQNADQST